MPKIAAESYKKCIIQYLSRFKDNIGELVAPVAITQHGIIGAVSKKLEKRAPQNYISIILKSMQEEGTIIEMKALVREYNHHVKVYYTIDTDGIYADKTKYTEKAMRMSLAKRCRYLGDALADMGCRDDAISVYKIALKLIRKPIPDDTETGKQHAAFYREQLGRYNI